MSCAYASDGKTCNVGAKAEEHARFQAEVDEEMRLAKLDEIEDNAGSAATENVLVEAIEARKMVQALVGSREAAHQLDKVIRLLAIKLIREVKADGGSIE